MSFTHSSHLFQYKYSRLRVPSNAVNKWREIEIKITHKLHASESFCFFFGFHLNFGSIFGAGGFDSDATIVQCSLTHSGL